METDTPDSPEPVESLKLRLGPNYEFDAKGPSKIVAERLAIFKELVQLTQAIAPPAAPASAAVQPTPEVPPPAPAATPSGNGASTAITPDILNRVFQSKGDSLSLLALPSDATGADSLLVLLYGFARLKDTPNVTGVSLMAAAKQSGVQVPRVDRVIDARLEYITFGGTRRGRRYGLNNRGVKYAEELISKLVQ